MSTIPLKNWISQIRSLSLPFNLQRRDRIALSILGVAFALFLIVQLVIFPILDRRDRLQRQIVAKTEALHEIGQLATRYRSLTSSEKNNEAMLKRRAKGFRLFSFLDGLAGQSNIKPNIIYMKPSSANIKNSPYTLSMVEMKINGLTMEQLISFLYGVETSPNMIWVKRISIARGENEEDLLNAILQVETYQL